MLILIFLNIDCLQFEFGLAVLLLSPVICSIMAFLRSLTAEEMSMTSKPRKVLYFLLFGSTRQLAETNICYVNLTNWSKFVLHNKGSTSVALQCF